MVCLLLFLNYTTLLHEVMYFTKNGNYIKFSIKYYVKIQFIGYY